MKKIIKVLFINFALIMVFVISVSAVWSSNISVTVPAWGGSVSSSTSVTKTSTSKSVSFKGITQPNALGVVGYLVKNGSDISYAVKIVQNTTYTSQSNSGTTNDKCTSRVKSNTFEPNSNTVVYQFDPS